jgi:hypothetical protein
VFHVDPFGQSIPERLPLPQPILLDQADVLGPFDIPVVREFLRRIVGEQVREVMDMIRLDAAKLGLSLPGVKPNPKETGSQDGEENFVDLGRTAHQNHLNGRSRIESALATAVRVLTRTSTVRASSAAART